MSKRVILHEDDADLACLVQELLQDSGYVVTVVAEVQTLLSEAARLTPCVALVDSSGGSSFDLWWVGPQLQALGVPPVAFTAHASAIEEFKVNANGYVGVITKPFDADEFIEIVNEICWEEHEEKAAS